MVAAGAETAVDAALRLDSEIMLVDDPVKRVDNMSMAWGLEARVPFLDHELVELAARMPPELKRAYGPDDLRPLRRRQPFEHREALGVKNFGHDSLETVLQSGFVPRSLLPAYESVARDLLKRVEDVYAATPHQNIRMHGDCHPGNMMCRDEVFHIVDLDDCRMGPAVQDLWMMLAGDRQECLGQLSELMDGYREFHDFDPRELPLIEGATTV